MATQPTGQLTELGTTETKRIDDVITTLISLENQGENFAEVAHDARNMVTALDLYCDLLQEPGVLATPFSHYGSELKLVASASRRLVEKLATLEPQEFPEQDGGRAGKQAVIKDAVRQEQRQARRWKSVPALPIENFAEALLASRNLLAAVAGPSVSLTLNIEGGAHPVHLAGEDLTRILVNLVKNASEAMSGVGRIHITLWESGGEPGNSPWLTLNVEDNGPGIPDRALDTIFEAGQSGKAESAQDGWPTIHRGLGLSIARAIVESARGTIHAANRDPVGACLQIELPTRSK